MSTPITAAAEPLTRAARSRCGPTATVRVRYGRGVALRITPEAARKLASELLVAADKGEKLAADEERNRVG